MAGETSRSRPVPVGVAALSGVSTIVTDVIAWLAATALAAFSRYDFDINEVDWRRVFVLGVFLAGCQLVLGALMLLYRGRYTVGSFDEFRSVAVSATAAAVVGECVLLALHPTGIARSLPVITWPLALVGMAAVRYLKRLIARANAKPHRDAEPILIFGAGWVGSALALRMLGDPASPFRPLGYIDDSPSMRRRVIHGLRVLGTSDALTAIAADTEARRIVVAVNKADAALIRRISDLADEAGIGCLVLPPLRELLRGSQIRLSTLREVNVEDVIGRRPVDTDVQTISSYVTNRRVLVTGAGGSIGAELCRQLHAFGPSELVMLDRDESALHAVELSIYGRGLLDTDRTELVDIRDAESTRRIFEKHQPNVVFHAAALKHLPLLERFPIEALKSNVYGTLNVLDASAAVDVSHFVNISTDKAANPASALGHSKRLAELLTSWYSGAHPHARYLSVRFGNVLGSRGSVLHTFAAQIDAGGPVTVTDPEVTRYFMTIPEACQLVIQAGAIGRPGEALVLDMGTPVKILDVAKRMIAMSGQVVEVVITGLREGEKLHEDLFDTGETDTRPVHELISHVTVPPLDPSMIEDELWPRLLRQEADDELTRGSSWTR